MGQVALDLSPVVSSLLERPLDRPSLDRAYRAVGGHPQAYATALRCAAKKARDPNAAAYWFAEAARIHESMDDLGGAIALLWRALECDRSNPRSRELLAATMVRLSMRAGLGFTFTPGAAPESGSSPVETGLRPPAPERQRDTLPELFGVESVAPSAVQPDTSRSGEHGAGVSRATLPSPSAAPPSPLPEDAEIEEIEAEPQPRRVEQLLPPSNDSSESRVVRMARTRSESGLHAVARATLPSVITAPPPDASDEVYAEDEAPPTVRPAGDRLVGGMFEALHGLHFLPDVREGAAFVCHTLHEKMRPAAALVHLYDINSAHFIVVSAEGNRAAAVRDYATPEDDPFIVQVMKADEGTLVKEPQKDPRLCRGRWLLVEPKRCVLCAPLVSDGRQLGLLELSDPVDGGDFTEDDRNVLMYAASALSRFLDRRGLVLSDEPERSSPAASV